MAAKHLFEAAALLQVFLAFTVNSIVPPASAATPTPLPVVGIRGYRRFHANDSYIGTSIPCTYEEKLCFRYNTLYSRFTRRCLEEPDICDHAADRQEFLHGSGHLLAACRNFTDPCVGGKYRMAFDGRCYPARVVREVLCGCAAPPTPHFLGVGVECRCPGARRSRSRARVRVRQPRQEGRCRIPDLRFPDTARGFLYGGAAAGHGALRCSAAQAACFADGRVAVRGACHALHARGPCPPDHVVALDAAALRADRADGACVHARGGCPAGQRRMAFDGSCHRDRDIGLLTAGRVRMTADGQFVVDAIGVEVLVILSTSRFWEGNVTTCLLTYLQNDLSLRPQHTLMPPCASDDEDLCRLYDVEAEPPLPELD
ncbi:hypothetical protein R5R35_014710 [Gryllus longicercus]|uniref:Uncharacterized protein n=1 Tax=Gryllus longicercus TaxID=2509291 RepID=A0AAN9YWL3_9ORTH